MQNTKTGWQPQDEIPQMLRIAWTRGPDLPQGLQDSDGGIIGNHLITVCGFGQGENAPQKPGRYPRGFLNKVWAWDVTDSAGGWTSLPDFPGTARQGLSGAVVDNALYCWGGCSYSPPPYTYKDGYRLHQDGSRWIWEPLPPLPHPLGWASTTALDQKIYLFGGADYDLEKFYTQGDRFGKIARMGARLYLLDTDRLSEGWQELSPCTGTPRWVNAMAVVDGILYIIGGATGNDFVPNCPYCTVVDNWQYDPARDAWTRLRDLPIASGNFSKGNIVFLNRYILLVGGGQYAHVANPDGTLRDRYGTGYKVGGKGEYYADVFVYDTETGLFGRATPLPINNNCPMAVMRGNDLFLIGGECDGRELDGVYYGHHPDLCLIGHVTEIATV